MLDALVLHNRMARSNTDPPVGKSHIFVTFLRMYAHSQDPPNSSFLSSQTKKTNINVFKKIGP
jgi:hypothetical protein